MVIHIGICGEPFNNNFSNINQRFINFNRFKKDFFNRLIQKDTLIIKKFNTQMCLLQTKQFRNFILKPADFINTNSMLLQISKSTVFHYNNIKFINFQKNFFENNKQFLSVFKFIQNFILYNVNFRKVNQNQLIGMLRRIKKKADFIKLFHYLISLRMNNKIVLSEVNKKSFIRLSEKLVKIYWPFLNTFCNDQSDYYIKSLLRKKDLNENWNYETNSNFQQSLRLLLANRVETLPNIKTQVLFDYSTRVIPLLATQVLFSTIMKVYLQQWYQEIIKQYLLLDYNEEKRNKFDITNWTKLYKQLYLRSIKCGVEIFTKYCTRPSKQIVDNSIIAQLRRAGVLEEAIFLKHAYLITIYNCINYYLLNYIDYFFERSIHLTLINLQNYILLNESLFLEHEIFNEEVAKCDFISGTNRDNLSTIVFFTVTFYNIYFLTNFMYQLLNDKRKHSQYFYELVIFFELAVALKRTDLVNYRFVLKGKFDRHGRKKYKVIDGGGIGSTSLFIPVQYCFLQYFSKYGSLSLHFWLIAGHGGLHSK